MKRVLFVCTGNTCRSPMAEAIFRCEIDKKGLSEEMSVESAGLNAFDGQDCSSHAVEVMKEIGIDISDKKSQRVNLELIGQADLVVCMAKEHQERLERFSDIISEMTALDISDPYGTDCEIYRKTRDEIDVCVKEIFKNITEKQGE